MKRIIFIGCLLVVTGLGACKKETGSPSLTQILTARPWKATGSISQAPGGSPIDSYPAWKACDKDNKYIFLSDSSYLYMEGPTRCNPADPDLKSTAFWELSADGKILKLSGVENRVVMLTKDSLILERNSLSGFLYTYKFSPY